MPVYDLQALAIHHGGDGAVGVDVPRTVARARINAVLRQIFAAPVAVDGSVWPSECDDVIRRAHVSREQRAERREQIAAAYGIERPQMGCCARPLEQTGGCSRSNPLCAPEQILGRKGGVTELSNWPRLAGFNLPARHLASGGQRDVGRLGVARHHPRREDPRLAARSYFARLGRERTPRRTRRSWRRRVALLVMRWRPLCRWRREGRHCRWRYNGPPASVVDDGLRSWRPRGGVVNVDDGDVDALPGCGVADVVVCIALQVWGLAVIVPRIGEGGVHATAVRKPDVRCDVVEDVVPILQNAMTSSEGAARQQKQRATASKGH